MQHGSRSVGRTRRLSLCLRIKRSHCVCPRLSGDGLSESHGFMRVSSISDTSETVLCMPQRSGRVVTQPRAHSCKSTRSSLRRIRAAARNDRLWPTRFHMPLPRHVFPLAEFTMSSDSFHISLTNSFRCPECGGTYFRSWQADETSEREYGCKNEACGWHGNAVQAFTIPRVDPWLEIIFCENGIFIPEMDSSEARILNESFQLVQICHMFR